MNAPTRARSLIALAALAAVASGVLVVVVGNAAATRAAETYHHARLALDRDIKSAADQGYTPSDLQPISTRVRAVDSSRESWFIPARSGFFDQQTAAVAQLRTELKALERRIFRSVQTSGLQHIAAARDAIDQDGRLDAADSDLEGMQKRLDDIAKAQQSARSLTDFRSVDHQAVAMANDAGALATQLKEENDEIQEAAADLEAETGPDLGAIHKAGNDAISAGRNDATIAAYLNKPSPFKNMADVNRAYSRLERFAGQVGSGDVAQAAHGTTGVQRLASQIHSELASGLPSKAILISYSAQELWAYQDGKLVQDTQVTTGRPALPTDVGPMKVLSKYSPWTMHSPWPPGSPAWYPDTVVQMVLWFTDTGEGLHDAYWQSCCWGPGSQYGPNASHGCIHVPFGNEQFLFNWADVGTPVILYPGDGSPVSNQLSQMTTDDQGNPLSGPGH